MSGVEVEVTLTDFWREFFRQVGVEALGFGRVFGGVLWAASQV